MRKMMKHLSILSLLVFMTISGVYGQQDVKTYELKKGNTLDFILLNTKEGKGEDREIESCRKGGSWEERVKVYQKGGKRSIE